MTCMNYSCGNCSCDDVVTEAGHIETDLEKRGDVFLIVFACVLSLIDPGGEYWKRSGEFDYRCLCFFLWFL